MEKVVKACKNGAASSWALANRSQAMLEDRYPLGFRLSLHFKDLSIALMATAANLISKWIKKYRWIAWGGILAILVVAIDLIYTDLKLFI